MKTISEASAELGISMRAIRFYEDKGLFKPIWVKNGGLMARRFDDKAMAHLRRIVRYTRYGFTLRQIKAGISRQDLVKRHGELHLALAETQEIAAELAREIESELAA